MIIVPNTIDEIAKLPPVIAVDIFHTLLSIMAEIGSTTDFKELKPVDFDFWFGGTPCIVETYEDLKEIDVLVEHESGRWCNITEAVSDIDIAEYLTPEWIFMALMTNNNGGVGYYIPASLALSCPNILKVIALHKEAGNAE